MSLIILGHRLSHLGLFPGPMARVWIGSILYTTVYALVGLALAALFRNIPAAIVTVIVMPLVAENVVRGLLGLHVFHGIRGLAKLMPFSSGSQVFSYGPADNNGAAGFNELPGPWSWVLHLRRVSRGRPDDLVGLVRAARCVSGAVRQSRGRTGDFAGATACASKSSSSASGPSSVRAVSLQRRPHGRR